MNHKALMNLRGCFDTSLTDGPDTYGPDHMCTDTEYGYCVCRCHDLDDCGCECCEENKERNPMPLNLSLKIKGRPLRWRYAISRIHEGNGQTGKVV